MTYNHYEYSAYIAAHLKGINDYMCSVGDEDPSEVDNRLSRMKGPVLIAVDNYEADGSFGADEQLSCERKYILIILDHAKGNGFDTIRTAQNRCLELQNHIVSKLLKDFIEDENGLENLDPDSITTSPVGPFGDNMYGIKLDFTIVSPESWVYDENAWS